MFNRTLYVAILLSLVGAAQPASAEPRERRHERMRELREEIRRDGDGDARRRPDEPRGKEGRGGRDERSAESLRRLSPEEREKLRRDVRDAGREVYRR